MSGALIGKRAAGGVGTDEVLEGDTGEFAQQAEILARGQAATALPVSPR